MPVPEVRLMAAVEGPTDEAVVRRLVHYVGGAVLGPVYGKQGKPTLLKALPGYNNAARYHTSWFVLVDLDQDADCAPPVLDQWLSDPAPGMCFRIAVRAMEAWLLADRERIARFLSVPVSHIPDDPEGLADPKRAIVDLAVRSRRRAIREDMVPRPGSGRSVGPAYTSNIIEFIHTSWRPEVAMTRADSLQRSVVRLKQAIDELSEE